MVIDKRQKINANIFLKSAGLILLALSLSIFQHCSNSKEYGRIIDQDKMTSILLDLHLADAYSNLNYNFRGGDSMLIKQKSMQAMIFKKYQVDTGTFNRSFTYYVEKPAVLDRMYEKMIEILNRKETALERKRVEENPYLYGPYSIQLRGLNTVISPGLAIEPWMPAN